jgi:hypothetical protein
VVVSNAGFVVGFGVTVSVGFAVVCAVVFAVVFVVVFAVVLAVVGFAVVGFAVVLVEVFLVEVVFDVLRGGASSASTSSTLRLPVLGVKVSKVHLGRDFPVLASRDMYCRRTTTHW